MSVIEPSYRMKCEHLATGGGEGGMSVWTRYVGPVNTNICKPNDSQKTCAMGTKAPYFLRPDRRHVC